MHKQGTIELIIDGKRISAPAGQNVLSAALQNGINVPHLCFDEKLSPGKSCGLCVASINGGKPVKLCETEAANGMNIITENAEISEIRKSVLDKLLLNHRGDCIAPCRKACPADTDCQGYVALIANGNFEEALRLLKDSSPLPATLGRICTHPCENACRRKLVDAPVSLAALKRFAADTDLTSPKQYLPEIIAQTGKKVAVIGAGPSGLTAAWFLARAGHKTVIFEALPEPGGMIRIRIPDHRLPKNILDKEISLIKAMGVEIKVNTKVGRDITFEQLKKEYDAVFIAAGAWKNQKERLQPEDYTNNFGALELTSSGTIKTDVSFAASIPGVFAGGDAVNDGPGTAVKAIGEGKKAARAIDAFLRGIANLPNHTPYTEQNDLTSADFSGTERRERAKQKRLSEEERKAGSEDSLTGFIKEEAIKEASRCLECGCLDLHECKLLAYAKKYGSESVHASASLHKPVDQRHPYIFFDPNKCIQCGLCVRICSELIGYHSWVLEGEGDAAKLRTMNGQALQSTYCIGCGQCVEHCPTGALTEHNPRLKPLAVDPKVQDSVCNYCGVGCATKVYSYGNAPIKVTPREGGSLPENILCRHGRFGWQTAMSDRELTAPLLKKDGTLKPAAFKEAYSESVKKLREIQSEYGKDSVAVLVADRMTSEEIFLSQKLGEALGTESIYSANIYNGGLEEVFGLDGSTNSYRELADTDLIFIVGADVPSYYAMLAVPVRQAVQKGAKLLLAAADGWNGFNMLANMRAVVEDDTRFLKEMLKALIELGCRPENAAGFEALSASLSSVLISQEAMDFAKAYKEAKNAMIMLDRERVSTETARLLSAIAVVSGHIGKTRNGLIQMLQHNNTQSVALMDIRKKMHHLESDINSGKIKGLVLVEQFIPSELAAKLDFVLLLDSMKGPAFEYADIFLPMPGYGAFDGTYVSAEGRVQQISHAFDPPAGCDGYDVLCELIAKAGGKHFSGLDSIRKEIAESYPVFAPCLLEHKEFLAKGPVRFQTGYWFPDGQAKLRPALEKSPLFGNMVFADVPLVTWFGQLVSEGLLQY